MSALQQEALMFNANHPLLVPDTVRSSQTSWHGFQIHLVDGYANRSALPGQEVLTSECSTFWCVWTRWEAN